MLRVEGLVKHYPMKQLFNPLKLVKALDGVSFEVAQGKTLGIVGESGCGKSTLAKALMHLETPTDGRVEIDGQDVLELRGEEFRKNIQMIFQDPYGSLNPRKKAWQIVAEPLRINTDLTKEECRKKATDILVKVGIRPEYVDRYPHMFSGGQRQRIGVARALVLQPKVIICDEPVSALDVSIQAQVINLLIELQDEFNLTFLFISHDLSVVRHLSDDVLVIYLGKIAEYGPRQKIFDDPRHPYTKALLASTPEVDRSRRRERQVLTGELPSPLNPPTGCAFHVRCPIATDRCKREAPEVREVAGRSVACFYADES